MITVKFDQEVRDSIKSGVDQLANAVKVTLGPKGRNVIIDKVNGEDPQVTKDGVTVAKAIELKDRLENMGATVVKRVAEKSNDLAGDGTTTATVLTQAILKKGMKLVAAGYDPVEIQKGINSATKSIVSRLNEMTIKVEIGSDKIEQIATVSANNDKAIGKIVADAFKMVGNDGAVSVEEGAGFDTVIHKVDGLQFDRGLLSTYFSTSPEKTEVSLQHPMILVVDGKLTKKEQIMAVLEPVVELGKPLLVIAEDVTGDALSTLILNKIRGGHQIAAVKSPGFGTFRTESIKDIASIIGAEVVPADMVSDITKEYIDQLLGTASAVKIEQLNTVIMGGKRNEEKVQSRLKEIESIIKENKVTKFEIKKLEERKAKLGGGVAIIEVGAKSELEMKELKDRIDDAKEAVISALEEGVVIGGGSALISARESLHLPCHAEPNTDEIKGVEILLGAIEAPLRVICENANVSPDVIVDSVVEQHKSNSKSRYGYDAKKGSFEDMLLVGILDPKKVTRIALESAVSVAGTLLTTQCALIEE